MSDKIISPNGLYELDLTNSGQLLLYRRAEGTVRVIADADPLPPVEVPDPLPPTPHAPAGTVRLEDGVFCDDRGAFNALGASLFWALWGYKCARDRLTANLAALVPGRFDYVRIFGQVGLSDSDLYWGDRYIDPDWPDYAATLKGTLDLCGSHGMRVALCLFASIDRFPTTMDCEAFVDRVVEAVRGREHLILHWEVANEGYGTGSDRGQLRHLCRYLRQRVAGPVAITSAQDAVEAHHLYDGDIATLATEHFARDINLADGPWRPIRQPWGWPGEYHAAWEQAYPSVPAPRLPPCSNDEPIGPYSSVATEHDPLRLITAAAVSYICGCPSYVYHCGPGIFGGGAWGNSRSPANVSEVEGLSATLAGFRVVRDLMPPGVSGWERANSGWASFPWTRITADGPGPEPGCVRSYAAFNGQTVVCVPFGIRDHVQLAQKQRPMTWKVHSLLDGHLIQEGAGDIRVVQAEGAAQLILGRFM